MKVTLESTTQIVDVTQLAAGAGVARVWEGETDTGVKVFALILQVAVHNSNDQKPFDELIALPHRDASDRPWPSRFFGD